MTLSKRMAAVEQYTTGIAQAEAEPHLDKEWQEHQAQWDIYGDVLAEIEDNTPAPFVAAIAAALDGYDNFPWMPPAHERHGDSILLRMMLRLAEKGYYARTGISSQPRYTGPLALPGALCELFLARPDDFASRFVPEKHYQVLAPPALDWLYLGVIKHDCEECGYPVPSGPNVNSYRQCVAVRSEYSGCDSAPGMPFLNCPLCGGATGWHAHAIKQHPGGPEAPYSVGTLHAQTVAHGIQES